MPGGNNTLVTALILVLVVGRFLQRELRERRMAIKSIYLAPAIVGVIALGLVGVAAMAATPQTALALAAACAIALAGGFAIGVAVARFTTVRVSEEPGVLFARGSYATVAIWLVALALRFLARYAIAGSAIGDPRGGLSLALNAGLVVLLASALFFVRFRLVAAAKVERARGIVAASPAI